MDRGHGEVGVSHLLPDGETRKVPPVWPTETLVLSHPYDIHMGFSSCPLERARSKGRQPVDLLLGVAEDDSLERGFPRGISWEIMGCIMHLYRPCVRVYMYMYIGSYWDISISIYLYVIFLFTQLSREPTE